MATQRSPTINLISKFVGLHTTRASIGVHPARCDAAAGRTVRVLRVAAHAAQAVNVDFGSHDIRQIVCVIGTGAGVPGGAHETRGELTPTSAAAAHVTPGRHGDVTQFLPEQYDRIRTGETTTDPRALAVDRVHDVSRQYVDACAPVTSRVPSD